MLRWLLLVLVLFGCGNVRLIVAGVRILLWCVNLQTVVASVMVLLCCVTVKIFVVSVGVLMGSWLLLAFVCYCGVYPLGLQVIKLVLVSGRVRWQLLVGLLSAPQENR